MPYDPSFLAALADAAVAELDRSIPEKIAAEAQAIAAPDVALRVDGHQGDIAEFCHTSNLPDFDKIFRRYRPSILKVALI
jgi:hypothetical protein